MDEPHNSGRVIVVVGAGRSGTSAVTRALSALGVELGDRLRRGSGKNPTGFFEDMDLLSLNKRLRRALGIESDSVRLIEEAEWQAADVVALRGEAATIIRRRFGSYPLWGYKYGRTLRMLPFWIDVYRELGLDVAYAFALRNPLSVARSRAQIDPLRGTQEKSDLEWLVNVVPYFRMAAASPFVVVDFDRLIARPRLELGRMAERLALPITETVREGIRTYADEFLQPDRRHTVFTPDDLDGIANTHPLVRAAFRCLHQLATDEVPGDSAAFWTAWSRIESDLTTLAPVLRHIDRIEANLRHAERSPLGPLQSIPKLWRYLKSL